MEHIILAIIKECPGISGTNLSLKVMSQLGTQYLHGNYINHLTSLEHEGKVRILSVTPADYISRSLYFLAGTKFEFVMR